MKTLSASLEDYLEAIYHITAARKVARPRDIARRLGVGNSSVTGALRALAEKGMIEYAPYDFVTLTTEGGRRAQEIARRHSSLRNFLVKVLQLDQDSSDDDACRLEHALSRSVSERLIRLVEFVERCPRWGQTWIRCLQECGDESPSSQKCEACIQSCLEEIRARGQGSDPASMDKACVTAATEGA